MDRKLIIETVAMILMLVAFPTISVGASGDIALVWMIGFIAFFAGAVLPVITRFMNHSKDVPRDVGLEFDDRVS